MQLEQAHRWKHSLWSVLARIASFYTPSAQIQHNSVDFICCPQESSETSAF